MAKTIPASGAGAVRIILKNKQDFHFDLRSKEQEGNRTSYIFDVFYENVSGTLNMAVEEGVVKIAALNLGLGKVITLSNDDNLRKLANYVLGQLG
ncbi:hypothetical protein [uncultured Faecalibaculum sp.]|uniref:hypothetical protein n=1 Tax=uncultured Faecalibaculum sp. TaxID=1729681 RepID=UPI0025ED32B6|nr:hypothetical protein [uncultured Faecalibaculum sp.]